MRRRGVVAALVAAGVLGGCSQSAQEAEEPTRTPDASTSPQAPAVPPDPQPTQPGPCPYITDAVAADTNGQQVSEVRTSVGRPYPSCFFYNLRGEQQLSVRIYAGDPAAATTVVDKAAPVDTANPATEPPGWRGGYQAGPDGAVYAVAKDDTAVVATTNQPQSVKVRTLVIGVVHDLAL